MRYGVVCCDAGAANQLLAYLRAKKFQSLLGHFEGPASDIFEEFVPHTEITGDISDLVDRCDVVLTGSGWSSSIEHDARVLAAQRRKLSIAVLDNWTNYEARFQREGIVQLPDKIWVFDKLALKQARIIFADIEVELKHHAYQSYILNNVATIPSNPSSYLYLCEPIREGLIQDTGSEQSLLENFLTKINGIDLPRSHEVFLRLHPSEAAEKYECLLSKFKNVNVKFDYDNLSLSLSRSGNIVGVSSYALYLGYKAGRRIISLFYDQNHFKKLGINKVIELKNL